MLKSQRSALGHFVSGRSEIDDEQPDERHDADRRTDRRQSRLEDDAQCRMEEGDEAESDEQEVVRQPSFVHVGYWVPRTDSVRLSVELAASSPGTAATDREGHAFAGRWRNLV